MKAHKNEVSMKNEHESRITRLEVTIENINQALIRLDNHIENIRKDNTMFYESIIKRFEKQEGKIDDYYQRTQKSIESINSRMWTNMYWYVGGYASILYL